MGKTIYDVKAENIFKQFADRIVAACLNSIVPPNRLAGFIGVECAYDPHTGEFGEGVPRFEIAHYRALTSLRNKGYYVDKNGVKHTKFSGVVQADIKDATDEAIHNLASSWGPAQIMGWHVIHNLNCTVQDLKDPSQSLKHVVDLLLLTARPYIRRGDWPSVLRIWNTGRPDGVTAHDNYVSDAEKIAHAYAVIVKDSDRTPHVNDLAVADYAATDKVVPAEPKDLPDPEPSHEVTVNAETANIAATPAPTNAELATKINEENPDGVKANRYSLLQKGFTVLGTEVTLPTITDYISRFTGMSPALQGILVKVVIVGILVWGIYWFTDHVLKVNIWSKIDRINSR